MENQLVDSDEYLIKKGRMTKSPFQMSPDELKPWEEQEIQFVRAYLFSIGQPLVKKKDGVFIAESFDGTIEKL